MLVVPGSLQGQIVLPQQQCAYGGGFLTACATLQYIEFSGNTLTLVVSNTSDAVNQPDSYIGFLLLEFDAPLPKLPKNKNMLVEYGTFAGGGFTPSGYSETWKANYPKGKPGGFGHGWDLKINDKSTGAGDLRVLPNVAVRITIEFKSTVEGLALVYCGDDCYGRGWSAHMQSLGLDAEGSGYTTVPEPGTVLLLATGLLAVGGVGLFRRRRS